MVLKMPDEYLLYRKYIDRYFIRDSNTFYGNHVRVCVDIFFKRNFRIYLIMHLAYFKSINEKK